MAALQGMTIARSMRRTTSVSDVTVFTSSLFFGDTAYQLPGEHTACGDGYSDDMQIFDDQVPAHNLLLVLLLMI